MSDFGLTMLLAAIVLASDLRPFLHIRLQDLVQESPDQVKYVPHHISAIAFAPDGEEVAVLAGSHFRKGGGSSHLVFLAVNTAAPTRSARQVDFPRPLYLPNDYLQWSADAKSLVAMRFGSSIIDTVRVKEICRIERSRIHGLVDGGTLLGQIGLLSNSKLQYFDLSCKLKNEVPFEVVRGSDESDTSQAGGVLVLVDN